MRCQKGEFSFVFLRQWLVSRFEEAIVSRVLIVRVCFLFKVFVHYFSSVSLKRLPCFNVETSSETGQFTVVRVRTGVCRAFFYRGRF